MKNYIIILFLFLLSLTSVYSQQTRSNKLSKICIDPGHGGDKPGARGSRSLEKDINLAVGIKLGELIKEHLKDVEVIYTRKTDIDVALIKRSQIASKNKADLFISIHCNASPSRDAFGTETFAMGLTKSKENIEVAKKENADILSEANYQETYDGFDPNSPESSIFFSLYQNAYMEQSLSFADKIQKQFSTNTGLYNRGVKQAGFLVLFKTPMPAILTEIGFISNHREETYLISQKGQYEIAASIFRAICEYKIYKEGAKFIIPSIESLVPKSAIKADEELKQIEIEKQLLAQAKERERRNKEEERDSINSENTTNQKDLIYRVQFYTSPEKIDINHSKFKDFENIWTYQDKDLWKYTSGEFDDYSNALALQKDIKKKGYKDAFVVIFYNDSRITLDQARKIENQR